MAKLAKSAVQFEHPAKGANHCAMCRHFEAPDACAVVAGEIARGDWCDRFDKKSRYQHARSRRQRGE